LNKSAPSPQESLLSALRDVMLPWIHAGQLRILLAEPPFELPDGIRATRGSVPLLKNVGKRYAQPRTVYWPEAGVNARSSVYLGCVLEGEADIRIGVTERMVSQNPRLRGSPGYYILHLPAQTLFIVPAGVPLSDGFGPHWERPGLQAARSSILWIDPRPPGALLHTCHTNQGAHSNRGAFYIGDPHLLPLIGMLQEELHARLPYSTQIAESLFSTIVLRLLQNFRSGSAVPHSAELAAQDAPNHPEAMRPDAGEIVQRACRYIRTNYGKPLSLDHIAAQVFVSATHLNRLFDAELGTSAMKYVVRCRVEAAQSLLLETDLTAREVSQHAGFAHPSHLSQVFARELGIAPTEYRRQHRKRATS
jgi:AraC-like DNA-binding protein